MHPTPDKRNQIPAHRWGSAISTRSSRWIVPLLGLVMGVVLLIASWSGGNPGTGAGMLGIMWGYALLLLVGGRSQTLRVLGGRPADERYRLVDLKATAFAGTVVILGLIGAWVYELAQGNEASPYTQLLAVGGLAYVLGVIFFRWRA